VGFDEGIAEGFGVGNPFVNVGELVGSGEGGDVGAELVGLGVGLPGRYVGINVGSSVGLNVGDPAT